jgi:hypothetical protein
MSSCLPAVVGASEDGKGSPHSVERHANRNGVIISAKVGSLLDCASRDDNRGHESPSSDFGPTCLSPTIKLNFPITIVV